MNPGLVQLAMGVSTVRTGGNSSRELFIKPGLPTHFIIETVELSGQAVPIFRAKFCFLLIEVVVVACVGNFPVLSSCVSKIFPY